jgi:hypothetical protein
MLDTSIPVPLGASELQVMQVSAAHGRCSFCHAVAARHARRGDGRICQACVAAVISLLTPALASPRPLPINPDAVCTMCRTRTRTMIRGRVNAWSCTGCLAAAAQVLAS